MITREEAVEKLIELESNGLLNDDLQAALSDIRCCVEEECKGLHMWGADDAEYMELHVARRADLWTKEAEEKCMNIYNAHKFEPAPYEKDEIDSID